MKCDKGLGLGIDYSSYFNQIVKLSKYSTSNSPYFPDSYDPVEIDINVRISGSSHFYRNKDDQISVAELVYKTLYPVKLKDKINGALVTSVKAVYEFDGSLAYYKVYV